MSLVHLKVLSDASSAALSVFDDSNPHEPRWRWNPDAKLVPGRNGSFTLANFAKNRVATLDADDGKRLIKVSGTAIPFRMPEGLSTGALELLRQTVAFIADEQISDYEKSIRAQIAKDLDASHGLIIMPTEKCNFRCTYCYESFEKGRMSPENADAVSRAVIQRAEVADHFAMSFFGGEPLMCPDLVLRFAHDALGVRARRGASFAANVTTNGYYLTPALIDDLLEAGVVNFQITLDGDQANHDRQRRTTKGHPTFQIVVDSLRALAKQPKRFHCILRCNVHADHADVINSLFDSDAMAPLRNDSRFEVYVEEIWSSDRQSIDEAKAREDAQSSAACGSGAAQHLDHYLLANELAARGFRTPLSKGDTGGLAHACYAGKPNWFVIGSDLTLYKCTVVFDLEENKVGRVNPDGTFWIDEGKARQWTGSNATTDSSCGTCHLRVPCAGISCPLPRVTQGHKRCWDAKTLTGLTKWSKRRPV